MMSTCQADIVCTAIMLTVLLECPNLHSSLLDTDLCVAFRKSAMLFPWLILAEGKVLQHMTLRHSRIHGYRNLKPELTEASKILDTLDIFWGHRWSQSSNLGAASGFPKGCELGSWSSFHLYPKGHHDLSWHDTWVSEKKITYYRGCDCWIFLTPKYLVVFIYRVRMRRGTWNKDLMSGVPRMLGNMKYI